MKAPRAFVLVAEDDADDRMFLREAFEAVAPAVQLEFLEDGQALLETLERTNSGAFPDLLLLDVNMPRVDGKQVLRRMAANKAWKHLPVLVLSTVTQPAAIRELYALGANVCIPKPGDTAQLQDMVGAIHNLWFQHAALP